MKKVLFDVKYLMIFLIIIIGLMLTFSGAFTEVTTYTAYRTEIVGEDTINIAKWDVVGLTKNKGANIDLNVGFAQEVTTDGNWYFEIENKSDVSAIINKSSTIKFKLLHSAFESFADTVSWDFLGTGKDNPVQFTISAYNAKAEDLLTYKHKTNGTILSHSEFSTLSVQDRLNYEEIFTQGSAIETVVAYTDSLSFTKKSEIVDGETIVFFETSVTMNNLTDDEINLGQGADKSNTTFRVKWTVGSETDNDTFYCYKCRAILNGQKNGSVDFHTGVSNWNCTNCHNDLIIESFDTIMNSKYYRYLISDSADAIEGYTLLSGSFDKVNGIDQYLFKSNEGVDFFTYLKYTSSLGGQPMFEFLNAIGTQTILIPFESLTDDQRNEIKGYSVNSGEAKHAWEKLTYEQYEVFERHNIRLQDNLAYMSYGVKLQIIFDIMVEQVV